MKIDKKDLAPVKMYLTGYESKGDLIIELRKKIKFTPENEDLIKTVVFGAIEDKPIYSNIQIKLRDKLMAKIFWHKHKPEWFKKK